MTHLSTQPTVDGKKARWLDTIAEYDINIVYKKGRSNVVADYLSRLNTVFTSILDKKLLDSIASGYSKDAFFAKILNEVGSSSNASSHSRSRFFLDNNLLFLKDKDVHRLCIPNSKELRSKLLHDSHDSVVAGHQGVNRSFELLHRLYFWPKMFYDVKDYVLSCDSCQRNKPLMQKPAGLLQPLDIPTRNWESISMDFIVKLPVTKKGHDSIMVVVDRLSKMTHFIPTRTDVTASQVASLFVDNIFRLHGLPKVIVSDRDSKFTGNFWKALHSLLGIKLSMSSSLHPQSDGQTERMNRCLEEALRSYVNFKQDNWDELLGCLEFALNNSIQSSTNLSPFYLNYGFHPHAFPLNTQSDNHNVPAADEFVENMRNLTNIARDNIQKAQLLQSRNADSKRREERFEVGDQVLAVTDHLTDENDKLRPTKKLSSNYTGPFTIVQKLSQNSVRIDLKNRKAHPTIHVSKLRKYIKNPERFQERLPKPAPIKIKKKDEYEVEDILAQRIKKKKTEYLVRWKGYGKEDDTWEPASNLTNAQRILKRFLNKEGRSVTSTSFQ